MRSATCFAHATIARVLRSGNRWVALGHYRSEVLARAGAAPELVRATRRLAWALDCAASRLEDQTGYHATRARLERLRLEFERVSTPQLCFPFAAPELELGRRLAVLHVG